MRPGVVIWVLGSEEKLAAAGSMIRDALKDLFAAVEVFSQKDADVEQLGRKCREVEGKGGAALALSHASKRQERDAFRKSGGGMIEVLLKGAVPPGLDPPFYPEMEIAEGDGEAEIKAGLMAALKAVGLLDESSKGYDEEEEKLVRERLEKLGYL
jgi:hypothetical protein